MATPLTDSINALTTYANEVTGQSDTTLSDAVHTLASGYGQGGTNYLNCVTRLGNVFNGSRTMPQRIEFSPILDAGNNNGYFMNRAYETGKNNATIDVIIHFTQTTPFSLSNMFYQSYGIKSLKITGDLSYVTSYDYFIDFPTYFKSIDMIFDFTSCSSANDVRIAPNSSNSIVESLRFAPNTLAYSFNLSAFRTINADTLVSLANCLRADAAGQTLTLYSTQSAMCQTIVGTNDNGTFVANAIGTMSLADFITNVKGWTLA